MAYDHRKVLLYTNVRFRHFKPADFVTNKATMLMISLLGQILQTWVLLPRMGHYFGEHT